MLVLLVGLHAYILFEISKYQATPGKKLLNLYVSDINNLRLTFKRTFAYLLCIMPLLPFTLFLLTSENISNYDIKASNSLSMVLLSLTFMLARSFLQKQEQLSTTSSAQPE